MTSLKDIKNGVDWTLVIVWGLLMIIGWLNIFASVHFSTSPDIISRPEKQVIWIASSFLLAAFILFVIKPRLWGVLATPGYILVLVLLVSTIFVGSDIKGSHSWITFGPVSFQPCEISKITTSLTLAAYMGRNGFKLSGFRNWLNTLLIILVPAVAILAEKETGSMLVYAGFIFMLYREGLSGWFLGFSALAIVLFIFTLTSPRWVPFAILGVSILIYLFKKHFGRKRYSRNKNKKKRLMPLWYSCIALVAGTILIFTTNFAFNNVLKDHQRSRIEVLLGMREDPSGVGYNVNQSMIAIGSGGFLGKGYLHGTQTTFGFVPEQSTDFIFCTVGEEWGFLGCLVVIALYVFLIGRIILNAESCREPFNRIYGYCVASCFFMHLFINVGMTIGLMPVIGIPLPFLSYGGSSLWAFTILLFIFISLHSHEKAF